MKNGKKLSAAFFLTAFALTAALLSPAGDRAQAAAPSTAEKESSTDEFQDALLPELSGESANVNTTLTAAESSASTDSSFAESARVNYTKNILTGQEEILEVTDAESDWSISFKSSDTSVVSLEQLSDTTCLYRGEAYGSAKITVTIKKTTLFFFREKKTIKVKVNVTPTAVSIKFQSGTKEVEVGQKVALPVTVRPSISKEKPTYESSNKKIAKVGSAGKVTGKKVGVVTITATIANGNSARCKVYVVNAAQ